MPAFRLFAHTPPEPPLHAPVVIDVPDTTRAEIVRPVLEQGLRAFEAYAERQPLVRPALSDAELRTLVSRLAALLDEYVAPGVVADVNAFGINWTGRANITQETYRRYAAACLERSADPYQPTVDVAIGTQTAHGGHWSGVAQFYRRYPMVRQMVDVSARQFVNSVLLCCDRVVADWPDIQTFFMNGAALNTLSRISATGSDFHKGGKQVLILTFRVTPPLAPAVDQRLIYKPSDVERDFRIVGDTQALANALNGGQLRVVTNKGVSLANLVNNGPGSLAEMANALSQNRLQVPTYRILPVYPGTSLAVVGDSVDIRQSYGYAEFLSSDAADNQLDDQQIRAYYHSFGAQAAIAWAFQLTDMHQENVIVHAGLPYMIDLEMAYTGIMPTPDATKLDDAYWIFSVPSQAREIQGWDTAALVYTRVNAIERTKNAIYTAQAPNVPRQPVVADRNRLRDGFLDFVNVLNANRAAFVAWLTNGQGMVTRLLPFGTPDLQNLLWRLNDQFDPATAVTYSGQIVLRMQDRASILLGTWGDNFNNAVANLPINNAFDLNLNYDPIAPTFAFYSDPQMAADFAVGDIPAFYQKMSTTQALTSRGRFIPIPFGTGVQRTQAVGQAALTNSLTAFFATAPVLPNQYFTSSPSTIITNYLQQFATQQFAATRVQAAVNNINGWPVAP